MKRYLKMLMTLVALAALLVMTAAPTVAKKPDNPGKPDTTTTTTTTTEPVVAQPCKTVTTLRGTGDLWLDCEWTPQDNGAMTGTVTVTVANGEVSRVVVFVLDSAPGDICILEQWQRGATGNVFIAEFPLIYEDETTYWDNGTNWCEPFDPILGQRSDLNGEPLHVRVGVRAKKGTVVEVSLYPEQTNGS